MSDRTPPELSGNLGPATSPQSPDAGSDMPEAAIRGRRISPIWLIPLVAAGIAIWLIVTTLADRGPLVTIRFKTADGLTAQQTQVKHKAVALGTVENVRLSDDLSQVLVQVRMNRQGAAMMTDHARFWVVRPRLSPGSISGLETLVSGAFIEIDPGAPGGNPASQFVGLEEPPGVRSDEPGRTFTLKSARVGSLGPGSPVFYRDVVVGEVLGYQLGEAFGPVKINVFIREPFDRLVKQNTLFWNASGVLISQGPQGIHLELESLQAAFGGGVAFETPKGAIDAELPPPTGPDARQFQLYNTQEEAEAAGFTAKVQFVSYFKSSVRGLARGAPVEVFGLPVGVVNDVQLMFNPSIPDVRTRVSFELQPERLTFEGVTSKNGPDDEVAVTRALVGRGMRAVLESTSLITGQKAISLQFVPNAPPATLGQEGNALLLPSQAGGLDAAQTSIVDVAQKLDQIPFAEIGNNVNHLVASLNQTVGGAEMRASLHNLSLSLADVRDLVHKADSGATPLLKRLPAISAELQQAVQGANAAIGESGYGANSDFEHDMSRLLDQVNDAARSVRLLADFLERHPEALVLGRTAHK